MTRVLLTGYGGFLGSEILRQLLARGFRVRGVARRDYPELRQSGDVETRMGDIRDLELARHACVDCDAVIHTAAKAGVWGRWQDYYRTNTQGTRNLLHAACQAGIRTFVFTSSPSVTFAGQPQSGIDESVPYPQRWLCHYPQTKALAEQHVLQAAAAGEIRACALRPHLIWGAGDPHLFPRVVSRALHGRLRRVGHGRNLIDVVHVRSAAQAHVTALERLLDDDRRLNAQALFLTDGRPVGCWDWITQILETAGVPVPERSISYRTAYRIGGLLEAIHKGLRIRREPVMTRFVAAQLALDHYFSIDRARQLLDYRPEAVDTQAEFTACRSWLQELAA